MSGDQMRRLKDLETAKWFICFGIYLVTAINP